MISNALKNFIHCERLPESYEKTILRWFFPLAESLKQRCLSHARPLIVGIQGAQGSGKSTLALLLVEILKERHQLKAINLSLDDFYLTRAERLRLSCEVHPLLKTRGVPGTHDLILASEILDALCARDSRESVALPRFDKARDERFSVEAWPRVKLPLDVILLEGWCLSAPPENDKTLMRAVNVLEEKEDPSGLWRQCVNDFLKTEYAVFFRRLDLLIVLQVPSFKDVYEWRSVQERKLEERIDPKDHPPMKKVELTRFIQHFERVTRNCLATLPQQADILFKLNAAHEIIERVDQ